MATPQGLSGVKADRAAEIFAESRAPIPDADCAILRGVLGYGVWWWDGARVRELVGDDWSYDPLLVLPETALRGVADGWRQLQLNDGYEAQLWREATLVASVWRRRPFTDEQWDAFVRGAHEYGAGEDTPASSPVPEEGRLDAGAVRRVARVRPRAGWKAIERGAALAILVSLVAAAGLFGRAIGFDALASAERRAMAPVQSEIAARASAKGGPRDLQTLRDIAARSETPNPLLAGGELFRILQARGVSAATAGLVFSIQDGQLRVEAPVAPTIAVEGIASDLEDSAWFSGVMPEVDASQARARLSARVCNPLAPAAGFKDPCAGAAEGRAARFLSGDDRAELSAMQQKDGLP